MSESAEQVVLQYLAEAAEAAHGEMTMGERVEFVERLRERIEAQRAKTRASDPEQVRKITAKLGDPKRLVARECERLAKKKPGAAAERKPSASAGQEGKTTDTNANAANGKPDTGSGRKGRNGGSQGSRLPMPGRAAEAMNRASRGSLSRPAKPRARGGPERSRTVTVVGWGRPPGRDHARLPTSGVSASLRNQRIELGAAGLLGAGGLLLPVPLWLLGVVLVCWARVWKTADLAIALVGPLAVAAVGAFVMRESGATVWDTVTGPGLLTFRFASTAGAIYLAVRLVTGATGSRKAK